MRLGLNDNAGNSNPDLCIVCSRYRGVAMVVDFGSMLHRSTGSIKGMNDNKKSKPVGNAFAVCWCMSEIGALIIGIVMAITTGNQLWLLMSLAAGAMLMGGV